MYLAPQLQKKLFVFLVPPSVINISHKLKKARALKLSKLIDDDEWII